MSSLVWWDMRALDALVRDRLARSLNGLIDDRADWDAWEATRCWLSRALQPATLATPSGDRSLPEAPALKRLVNPLGHT